VYTGLGKSRATLDTGEILDDPERPRPDPHDRARHARAHPAARLSGTSVRFGSADVASAARGGAHRGGAGRGAGRVDGRGRKAPSAGRAGL